MDLLGFLYFMEQPTEKGCVYFFKHKGLKPIKIGYTSKQTPIKRFETMKMYAPYGAEIIGFIITKNPKQLEEEIHLKYKSRSLNGEWFNIDEEDVIYCINKYTSLEEKSKRLLFEEKYAKSLIDKENKTYLTKDLSLFLHENLIYDTKISRTSLKEMFIENNPLMGATYTSQKFNKAVNHYCKINYLSLKQIKNNGSIFFVATKR